MCCCLVWDAVVLMCRSGGAGYCVIGVICCLLGTRGRNLLNIWWSMLLPYTISLSLSLFPCGSIYIYPLTKVCMHERICVQGVCHFYVRHQAGSRVLSFTCGLKVMEIDAKVSCEDWMSRRWKGREEGQVRCCIPVDSKHLRQSVTRG